MCDVVVMWLIPLPPVDYDFLIDFGIYVKYCTIFMSLEKQTNWRNQNSISIRNDKRSLRPAVWLTRCGVFSPLSLSFSHPWFPLWISKKRHFRVEPFSGSCIATWTRNFKRQQRRLTGLSRAGSRAAELGADLGASWLGRNLSTGSSRGALIQLSTTSNVHNTFKPHKCRFQCASKVLQRQKEKNWNAAWLV